MAVAAVVGAERRGLTQDERFVVFASSTGTVFEWYDFLSLRDTGAVFRVAVLSIGQ